VILEHIDKGIRQVNEEVEEFDGRYDLTRSIQESLCINCNRKIQDFDHVYFVIIGKKTIWWHQWQCRDKKRLKESKPWWHGLSHYQLKKRKSKIGEDIGEVVE
jgi:hypothetical protein